MTQKNSKLQRLQKIPINYADKLFHDDIIYARFIARSFWILARV